MTKELIRLKGENVPWYQVLWKYDYEENFLRELKDVVDWRVVSFGQDLSKDFMREMKDKIDNVKDGWQMICTYQKFDLDFVKEFRDKLSWVDLHFNSLIKDEELKKKMVFYLKDGKD